MTFKCTCGLPEERGVVHRHDLPCYIPTMTTSERVNHIVDAWKELETCRNQTPRVKPHSKVLDPHQQFLAYFNEREGYGLRSERFFQDVQAAANNTTMTALEATRLLASWMEAAYRQGLRDMAQDTLDTLGDYATAVAGIDEVVYTREAAYDAAHGSLMVYYTQVLNEHQD